MLSRGVLQPSSERASHSLSKMGRRTKKECVRACVCKRVIHISAAFFVPQGHHCQSSPCEFIVARCYCRTPPFVPLSRLFAFRRAAVLKRESIAKGPLLFPRNAVFHFFSFHPRMKNALPSISEASTRTNTNTRTRRHPLATCLSLHHREWTSVLGRRVYSGCNIE